MSEHVPEDSQKDEGAERSRAREEHERAYKREWRRRNADRLREYRATYNAEHREEIRARNREYMRRRHAGKRAQNERRERRRVYSRRYYAENRDSYLDSQRAARARRKAADPERYLRLARESQRRWREGHRDRVNGWQRERYEADPEAARERSARYYADNRERILAKHRRRWAENREELLAKQRAYRGRERRRRAAGLPPQRIHRVLAADRRANEEAADAFFARARSAAEIAAVRDDVPIDPADLARWARDCARARAAFYCAETAAIRDHTRACDARRAEAARVREEEERLDAIARVINDRLRQHRRRGDTGDAAAPIQSTPRHGGGLTR